VAEETWLIGLHGCSTGGTWRRPDLEAHLPPFCPVAQAASNFLASYGPKAPGRAHDSHTSFEQGSAPRQPECQVGTYLHFCCNVILSVSDKSLSGFGQTHIEIASRTPTHPSKPAYLRARHRPGGRARQGKSSGGMESFLRELGCQELASSHLHRTAGRGRASSESIKV